MPYDFMQGTFHVTLYYILNLTACKLSLCPIFFSFSAWLLSNHLVYMLSLEQRLLCAYCIFMVSNVNWRCQPLFNSLNDCIWEGLVSEFCKRAIENNNIILIMCKWLYYLLVIKKQKVILVMHFLMQKAKMCKPTTQMTHSEMSKWHMLQWKILQWLLVPCRLTDDVQENTAFVDWKLDVLTFNFPVQG